MPFHAVEQRCPFPFEVSGALPSRTHKRLPQGVWVWSSAPSWQSLKKTHLFPDLGKVALVWPCGLLSWWSSPEGLGLLWRLPWSLPGMPGPREAPVSHRHLGRLDRPPDQDSAVGCPGGQEPPPGASEDWFGPILVFS